MTYIHKHINLYGHRYRYHDRIDAYNYAAAVFDVSFVKRPEKLDTYLTRHKLTYIHTFKKTELTPRKYTYIFKHIHKLGCYYLTCMA